MLVITFISSIAATAFATNMIFNPPKLEMGAGVAEFTVALAAAPAETATLTFNYEGFQFSVCSIQFTKDNYKIPVPVKIQSTPSFGKDSNAPVKIAASLCTAGTLVNETYTVTPVVIPGGVCHSVGGWFFV